MTTDPDAPTVEQRWTAETLDLVVRTWVEAFGVSPQVAANPREIRALEAILAALADEELLVVPEPHEFEPASPPVPLDEIRAKLPPEKAFLLDFDGTPELYVEYFGERRLVDNADRELAARMHVTLHEGYQQLLATTGGSIVGEAFGGPAADRSNSEEGGP